MGGKRTGVVRKRTTRKRGRERGRASSSAKPHPPTFPSEFSDRVQQHHVTEYFLLTLQPMICHFPTSAEPTQSEDPQRLVASCTYHSLYLKKKNRTQPNPTVPAT